MDWLQSTAEHVNMYTLPVENSRYSKIVATIFLSSEIDVGDTGGGDKGMAGSKGFCLLNVNIFDSAMVMVAQ
jgi:hypothetical protein